MQISIVKIELNSAFVFCPDFVIFTQTEITEIKMNIKFNAIETILIIEPKKPIQKKYFPPNFCLFLEIILKLIDINSIPKKTRTIILNTNKKVFTFFQGIIKRFITHKIIVIKWTMINNREIFPD